MCMVKGGSVSARSRMCVGGALDLGWLGTIYRQRTMPTYRMGYITICLDGKM